MRKETAYDWNYDASSTLHHFQFPTQKKFKGLIFVHRLYNLLLE
jgi:hypothetical protein